MNSKFERIKIGTIKYVNKNIYVVDVGGDLIECNFSTKAEVYFKLLPTIGDEIQIEISPVDSSRGRIEPRGFV